MRVVRTACLLAGMALLPALLSAYAPPAAAAPLRAPEANLVLLETILNAIHRGAPGTRIAFNTRPDDTDAAALRWLDR